MNIRESSKLHFPFVVDWVSIDFWLFPSRLRLVCIYITLLLCQHKTFFKNLAQREPLQSKARIEFHIA